MSARREARGDQRVAPCVFLTHPISTHADMTMSWLPSIFNKKTSDTDLIERYKEIRQIAIQLNVQLVKMLPNNAAPECGKKLGLIKAGTLILNNDDEIAILYDYCLHHYRRADKTVIDRYLETTPPEPESDEAILLETMRRQRFSIFQVEESDYPKVILRDLVAGGTLDIVDIGLSSTARPGHVLVGRILPLPEFNISSGIMIPLPEPTYRESIAPIVEKFLRNANQGDGPRFSPTHEASFVAQVIRVSLQAGGMDNSFYTDVEP